MKNRVSAFVFLTCFFLSLTTHAAADGLEHLWSRGFSSGGVTGAAIDASGRVLVMGDFDTPTINIGGDDLARVGEWDIFLGAFDANGVHVWSRSAGGTAWDRGGRIAADAWGNVIVTGFFEETANFGGEDIVSAGARDIGAHLWSVGLAERNRSRVRMSPSTRTET
jgi:hypothetical protein